MIRLLTLRRRRRADDEIDRLRSEIAATDRDRAPLAAARLCHRLAELYAGNGMRVEAVRAFGHGIDAYLYAGYTGAATRLCEKLIEYEPRVIRARATLAMLHLAAGREEEAADEIRGYVDATRERGESVEITRRRLRLVAELAVGRKVRALIATSLAELGDSAAGEEILRRLRREAEGTPAHPLSDQERWTRLMEAAAAA
jgi:hypothetical protein